MQFYGKRKITSNFFNYNLAVFFFVYFLFLQMPGAATYSMHNEFENGRSV